MQFRKVTDRKYVGEDGYSLIQCSNNSFTICKQSLPTRWGQNFVSVQAATYFINSHDYKNADYNIIPLSADDLTFAIEMYGLKPNGSNGLRRDNMILRIEDGPEDSLWIRAKVDNEPQIDIYDSDSLFKFLDSHFPENSIFSSVTIRGTELRSILAAKLPPSNDKRSARDATKNLVRVKSSNVWSYGVELKDKKSKVGDVYVQFKGRNGGAGDIYRYYDVPLTTWRQFLSAPSKGHFVWQYLRNNFLYSKLTGNKRGVLRNAVN